MANPDTWYLTAAEYRAQSTVPTLFSSSSDAEVQSLLLEVMAGIDAFIGGGWEPFTDGQEFIFPRVQDTDDDEEAMIPRSVSLATRMIADAVLKKRQRGILDHEVASDTRLGRSVVKHKRSIEAEIGTEHWPPEAVLLLQKYKRVGGEFALDDPTMAW